MKRWRGEYVTVEPGGRWHFHVCLCCGRSLSDRRNQTGYGPTCVKGPLATVEREAWRARALDADRKRYRAEVLAHGFRVEW